VKTHLSGRDDRLVKVEPMLAMIDNWRTFLDSAMPEEHLSDLRNHARIGRPLGSTPLIERMENRLGRALRPQKAGRKRKFFELPK